MKKKFFFLILTAGFIFGPYLPEVYTAIDFWVEDEEDINNYIDKLKSKKLSHREKMEAIDGLLNYGVDTVGFLSRALSNRYARDYAVIALGRIGDERAVDSLIGILEEGNVGQRREVIIALGKIGNADAVQPLMKVFKQEESLREDVLIALQQIDDDDAREMVKREMFKQEPNGLSVKVFAGGWQSQDFYYEPGKPIEMTVVFENTGSSGYYIYCPDAFRGSFFMAADDKKGKYIRSLVTKTYPYMPGGDDFYFIIPGQTLEVKINGEMKMVAPAKTSRQKLSKYWWEVLYPKGRFGTIDFRDSVLDVGALEEKFKVYFVFSQGVQEEKWGGILSRDPVWKGKVISEPLSVTVKDFEPAE